jgi:DNA-binding NtrC family response regulator
MDTVLGVTSPKSIDLRGAARPSGGDNPPDPAEKLPKRILVVDDEALIRWSVSETLTSMGMEVAEALDAASAVKCLSEHGPFDVIVLDFRLPDNDDLTLLKRVRAMSPESAVILMTAFDTPEVAEGAMRLGASTIVGKPFELREMAHLVETLAAHRHN